MDQIVFVVIVLFILVPLIGVVASKMREISQQQQQPGRPMAQGDARRIQEQIDEFLRRASQRGGQPQQPKPPPAKPTAPAAVEVLDDDQVGTGVNQQTQRYLDTSEFRRRSEALGGEVVQADEQFSQQVRKAFSGEVSKLSSRRGQTAAAPDVTEVELVGDSPEEIDNAMRPTLEALPAAGSGLADLLGSSDNIAHAVIMAEILRRPEW
jgi:hypothetical protein